MVKIVLASHGPMAEAMIESSKMLYGEMNNLSAVCLYPEDNSTVFVEKLRNEIDGFEEVLLLVDIPGGTPSNQGMMLLSEFCGLRIISGMNLMMILETLIQCGNMNVDDLKETIIHTGKGSIKEMSLVVDNNDELDDLLD